MCFVKRIPTAVPNGCFYSSANTNLCDATSELTVEGDLPSSLAICLHEAPRSSILWTVPLSCLVSLPVSASLRLAASAS